MREGGRKKACEKQAKRKEKSEREKRGRRQDNTYFVGVNLPTVAHFDALNHNPKKNKRGPGRKTI